MKTDWSYCTSGVHQGDALSTILFSIFINDFVLEINDVTLKKINKNDLTIKTWSSLVKFTA